VFLLTNRARWQHRIREERVGSVCLISAALALTLLPGRAAPARTWEGGSSSLLGAHTPPGSRHLPYCGHCGRPVACRAENRLCAFSTPEVPASTPDNSLIPEPPGWTLACASPNDTRDPSARMTVPAGVTPRTAFRTPIRDRGPPAWRRAASDGPFDCGGEKS
jgi:hypothetical protein